MKSPERLAEMEQTIMSAVAGGGIVLVGKIVWDWLSGNQRKPCPLHDSFYQMAMDNNQKLHKIAEDVAFIKGKIQL